MKDEASPTMSNDSQDPAGLRQFDVPAFDDWQRAALESLKRPSLAHLSSAACGNIPVEPIYPFDAAALAEAVHDAPPGHFPFRRGSDAQPGWRVSVSPTATTPEAANRMLRDDLEGGADALVLRLGVGPGRLPVRGAADVAQLLTDIPLDEVFLWIDMGSDAAQIVPWLRAHLDATGTSPAALRGCAGPSLFDVAARTGALPNDMTTHYDDAARWLRDGFVAPGALRTLMATASPWHDAGAHVVDELAALLSQSAELIRAMRLRDVTADAAVSAVGLQFSVGTSFFISIAALRALRQLYAAVGRAFGAADAACRPMVHAVVSTRHFALLDAHTNILRTTTAAFSAVLGGAQSIETVPHDALSPQSSGHARRIARNIQLVLSAEAKVTDTGDPTGGARLIESLTDEIADRAWQRFQELEAAGGFARALQSGDLARDVARTAAERRDRVATRQDGIVGVSVYAAAETLPPLDDPDGDTAVPAPCADCDAIVPVYPIRLSHDFENLRREVQQRPVPPVVFLALYAAPKDAHRLRAEFAQGFFATAGIKAIKSPVFDDIASLRDACQQRPADLVVLCSADDAYPQLAAKVVPDIKRELPQTRVVIAGRPGAHESAYRDAGVDAFVHLGCDVPQTLRALLNLDAAKEMP